jgi:hypothetical protein
LVFLHFISFSLPIDPVGMLLVCTGMTGTSTSIRLILADVKTGRFPTTRAVLLTALTADRTFFVAWSG